jgi:protein-tyrosine phosphatase
VVALFHAAMGVHRDDLLADYPMTNTAPGAAKRIADGTKLIGRAHGDGIGQDAVFALLSVRPDYLDAALAAIDERSGSMAKDLSGVLGVTIDLRARLGSALVE